MVTQPKAVISKFSEMTSQGGMFAIDGFSVERENGLMSIDENYRVLELKNSGTNNYSDLGSIMAIQNVYPLTGSRISASNGYKIMMNGSSQFFTYDIFSSAYNGLVASSAGSPYASCQKSDLFSLPSGNLIYTSSNHLGLMIRGLAKTGSSTTKIIDKDGRNFTTLGITTSAPNNKVTNLKTGAIYTITTISTTTATDDTLEFSASGALDNVENDEFIALVNTKFDLFKSDGTSGGSDIANPIFKGQQLPVYWSRPIRQYGNQYLIGNGNYLALLANSETTIDCSYKQLPTGYQLVSFDVNSSMILVSAYDNKGGQHLLLWDGFTSGWNEILNISRAPSSIKSYGQGWVYLSDGSVYFTDGRTTQKLISHPEDYNLGAKYNTETHNGIEIIDDVIYMAVRGSAVTNRFPHGVLVFKQDTGLSYFKCLQNGKGFASAICLSVDPFSSISSIFATSNTLFIGCEYSLNQLREFSPLAVGQTRSFMMYLDFEQETQIKEVWLNLKHNVKKLFTTNSDKNTKISVNYGDNKNPIIRYCQATITSTTSATNAGGATYSGEIGDEIELMDSDLAGQRTFITNITGKGTSSEAWTLSPALTGTSNTTNLRIWSVKNGETKSLVLNDLTKPIRFNTNFLGSRMWLEVVVTGVANNFPVSVDSIILS